MLRLAIDRYVRTGLAMDIGVQREGRIRLARSGDLYLLVQRFRLFGLDASKAVRILMTAPLVGSGSLFGRRRGQERPAPEGERNLQRFSPAPGFRFDLHLRVVEPAVVVVRFSQPERPRPYLSGESVWLLVDEGPDCLLTEEINTPAASSYCDRPLGGSRPSIRRWMFFQMGHRLVMKNLMVNLAKLANPDLW